MNIIKLNFRPLLTTVEGGMFIYRTFYHLLTYNKWSMFLRRWVTHPAFGQISRSLLWLNHSKSRWMEPGSCFPKQTFGGSISVPFRGEASGGTLGGLKGWPIVWKEDPKLFLVPLSLFDSENIFLPALLRTSYVNRKVLELKNEKGVGWFNEGTWNFFPRRRELLYSFWRTKNKDSGKAS